MLIQLSVSNYALIDSQDIKWNPGFTVITGETGSGKSILMGALSLIMGERADANNLFDKSKKCVIEAVFNLEKRKIEKFFSVHELDYDAHTLIRREVNPEGKSRAFVNDTPVNLSTLKELAELLIDIHSQHETLLLNKSSFRFDFVDSFASCLSERNLFREQLNKIKLAETELQDLISKSSQLKRESDFLNFQLNELDKHPITEGEINQLEAESQKLENAETIKSSLSQNLFSLSEGEDTILLRISQLKNSLSSLSKYGTQFEALTQRIHSVLIEVKDISSELSQMEEDVQMDPVKLNAINEKLDFFNRLLQKHGLKNEIELLQYREEIRLKLDDMGDVDTTIQKLEKALAEDKVSLLKLGKDLSEKRNAVIPKIQREINTLLSDLKMPDAVFNIHLEPLQDPDTFGIDRLRFLFSANKGSQATDLHKVASGGELSRLMLCMKAVMAKRSLLPTLIFDEIDTGVSGDVAHKMGSLLREMSNYIQIISITHSPQVAAEGKNHFLVYKVEKKGRTNSMVKELNPDERMNEIAKMISTGEPTPSSLLHAKELLKLN